MTQYGSEYPELTAIAAIVVGLILATLIARLSGKLMDWAEMALGNITPSAPIASASSRTFIKRFAYYSTLAIFVLFALRVLGFGGLTDILDALIIYIPGLIAGAVIIITGYLLGRAAYHLLLHTFEAESTLVPRVVQAAIVAISILTGLSQMSVDVSFISEVMIALLVLSLGGVALSFALGSGDYVANLLAKRHFNHFNVGERIRVNDLEGNILEFTGSNMMLETADGLAVVPAKLLAEAVVTKLPSQ